MNIDVLYNIVKGQVALNEVNVSDAVLIDEIMANSFRNSPSPEFYAKSFSQVKAMFRLKRGLKIGEKTAFGLETIFLRLHMSCAPYLPR